MKLSRYIIQWATAVFATLTLTLGLVLTLIMPFEAELAEGFRTPIIAFEFAQTEADLAFLSGNSAASKQNRDKMDAGHQWDMAFPFAYGVFIALLILPMALSGRRGMLVGMLAALLIIPFDIYENLTLIDITASFRNPMPLGDLLNQLYIATWLKWGAIGISITMLTLGLFRTGRYFSAVVAMTAAAGVVAAFLSGSNPMMTELMSMLVLIFFLYFSISSYITLWRWLAFQVK